VKFRIKYISFLFSGERQTVKSSINGRFLVKGRYTGHSKTVGPQTAHQFVTHPVIRESDPVLNLQDGRKVRVYLGGDPTHMVVEAHSLIEIHDSEALETQNKRNSKKNNKETKINSHDYCSPDYFEDLQGW